jgi:hypothetical protein
MWAQEVFHSTDSHNVRLYAQTYIYIMPFNIKDAVFLSDMWYYIVWYTVTERYTFSLHSFTQYFSKLTCTYVINRWAKFFDTYSSLHFTF